MNTKKLFQEILKLLLRVEVLKLPKSILLQRWILQHRLILLLLFQRAVLLDQMSLSRRGLFWVVSIFELMRTSEMKRTSGTEQTSERMRKSETGRRSTRSTIEYKSEKERTSERMRKSGTEQTSERMRKSEKELISKIECKSENMLKSEN